MCTQGELQTGGKPIGLLRAVDPSGLNAVSPEEWEEVKLTVDSRASETVVQESTLASISIKDGPQKKRGVRYEVANGELIDNLGERTFVGESGEGVARSLTAQVCDVNRDLLSVHRVVKAGGKVVFEDRELH